MSDAMEPPPAEPAELPRRWPAQVRVAFWVFLALIAARLVIVPFTFVRQWSLADGTLAADRAKYGAAAAGSGDAALHGATITGDVFVVALYALCVLAAFRLKRGASWARIVLTVLGVVSIATAAFALRSPTGIAIGVAGIAGTILLWLRPSNAWFREGSAARRAEARRRAEVTAAANALPHASESWPPDSSGSGS